MICAGIDAGSRTIKVVLIDTETLEVRTGGIMDQGVEQDALAKKLFENALDESGISGDQIKRIVATGYGRNIVSIADTTITEITCHAVGVCHEIPEAMTIIDIGGQDSKLMHMTKEGNVRDFAMNDRCAAGTGRFLEVIAARLGVELGSLGKLVEKSRKPATISSMCVVFAESEIIGLLASGESPEDIVAGVQASIATRIAAMTGPNLTSPVIFTGGVAMIPGMARALASALGREVRVAPDPMMTGALGAAILAAEQSKR